MNEIGGVVRVERERRTSKTILITGNPRALLVGIEILQVGKKTTSYKGNRLYGAGFAVARRRRPERSILLKTTFEICVGLIKPTLHCDDLRIVVGDVDDMDLDETTEG